MLTKVPRQFNEEEIMLKKLDVHMKIYHFNVIYYHKNKNKFNVHYRPQCENYKK